MGQMMDAQDRLQELYDADNEDAAAILGKEQREKFREWGHGYGPVMR